MSLRFRRYLASPPITLSVQGYIHTRSHQDLVTITPEMTFHGVHQHGAVQVCKFSSSYPRSRRGMTDNGQDDHGRLPDGRVRHSWVKNVTHHALDSNEVRGVLNSSRMARAAGDRTHLLIAYQNGAYTVLRS